MTWCPDTYETELVLKKISVADGSRSILGDPVAFKFIDVGSEVRLMYQEEERFHRYKLMAYLGLDLPSAALDYYRSTVNFFSQK